MINRLVGRRQPKVEAVREVLLDKIWNGLLRELATFNTGLCVISTSLNRLDRQKSSLRVYRHPKLAEHVSLSGPDGDDAKNYEEKCWQSDRNCEENQVIVIPCSSRGPRSFPLEALH